MQVSKVLRVRLRTVRTASAVMSASSPISPEFNSPS